MEIAHEILLRLAQRSLPPTPANYLAAYQEISGTSNEVVSGIAHPAAPVYQIESTLKELSAHLLEDTVAILLAETPELADEAKVLAMKIRATHSSGQVLQLATKIKEFNCRLGLVAQDKAEIRDALLKLLSLMISNIDGLYGDDKWLSGQINVVAELIDQRPLNIRHLDAAESRLRDLAVKQSSMKQELTQAQEQLKAMLATFIDQLASFTELTSDYHAKIENCVARIAQASTINELSKVLDDAMRETRGIQAQALHTHTDFSALKLRVEESEQEISRLRTELALASKLVRHDSLTNALNRKGMNEAIEREVTRRKRYGGDLSVAMLDIDNFKRFNDIFGHSVGDAALIHLSSLLRATIRPQDVLARYGGEEFFLLLPNANLRGATMAMTRVQSELARKDFLHNHKKIQITFSCGVAEIRQEESALEVIQRADNAMYMAKRTGKKPRRRGIAPNRVVQSTPRPKPAKTGPKPVLIAVLAATASSRP
ncbi:putative Diguanylate cyclase [Georgfuchsia toluolica]|uniref:diguanylate cyclase n=1 Tax=Georgfuchsia toluolica TaxID=424218 RepID=A0A916J3L4_9PROT|nr:GGDEF domain-containing protein [Georgfuchsia toluolica]CAG4883220.1 putative Diguanylate cyclase [Georgfuchsia toluolica]